MGARQAAADPAFRGAFLTGSAHGPPGARAAPANVRRGRHGASSPSASGRRRPRARRKGKRLVDGVLVDVSYLEEGALADPAWVAASFVYAPSFRGGQVLADPTGQLARLEAAIAPGFAAPAAVRARTADVHRRIRARLTALDPRAAWADLVLSGCSRRASRRSRRWSRPCARRRSGCATCGPARWSPPPSTSGCSRSWAAPTSRRAWSRGISTPWRRGSTRPPRCSPVPRTARPAAVRQGRSTSRPAPAACSRSRVAGWPRRTAPRHATTRPSVRRRPHARRSAGRDRRQPRARGRRRPPRGGVLGRRDGRPLPGGVERPGPRVAEEREPAFRALVADLTGLRSPADVLTRRDALLADLAPPRYRMRPAPLRAMTPCASRASR